MKVRQWYIELVNDLDDQIYELCEGWFGAVCKLLTYIEKGIPFTCKVDFFYRDGGKE